MRKLIQLPYLVTILLVVLVIAPFGLLYVPESLIDGTLSIFSLVWGFSVPEFGSMYFGFHMIPMMWRFMFVLSVFRFPFAYIVLRYWRGLAARRTFYSMGVVSFVPLLVYPVWYSYITGLPYRPFFIPLPFLLIVGLVLKRIMVTETQEERDTKRRPEVNLNHFSLES
ncbi:MAG: hypothetical protein ACXACG_09905 [Candidatus Thorarchaeota archaeon]|jgi:hypothetical protein